MSAQVSVHQMEELLGHTEEKLKSLEKGPVNVLEQMDDLQAKMKFAEQIQDDAERTHRMKILDAEMGKLRKQSQQEEKDLAEAVLGLNVLVEKMGGEYNNLTQLNATEKKLIEEAKAVLAEAESAFEEAQGSWFPLGKDARINEAEAEIKAAKNGIRQAKTEASQRMRRRLMTHSMEESLQEFQLKVDRTLRIMKTRLQDIKQQVEAVGLRKQAAFKAKEESAKALETGTEELQNIEDKLAEAEELLNAYPNGTPEFTAQEQNVSQLKSELEDIRGRRNESMGIFQSKEKFAKELEIHEVAQKKLRDNQRHWIKVLQSDTEERIITFRSRLEAMKASADQEVAKKLDDLGAEIDQSNADYMAQVTVASNKIKHEKAKAYPERIQKMAETQAALTEHITRAGEEMKGLVKEMIDKYGVDPTQSQFSTYLEDEQQ
ncbi:MAG: hypothetical protein GY862_23830 [Gammaproteobacteria bacterium]|nr:hypothetical protein [Gammaproteobacteria bacterium]